MIEHKIYIQSKKKIKVLRILGLEEEVPIFMSMQQQSRRFHLKSLCLSGDWCHAELFIQLLISFGSHLHKLRIDLICILNLIRDGINSIQLKSVILHRYLVYLELDTIYESEIDSEDFCRVVDFFFDNINSLRHVTLFPMWYLSIFESTDDMKYLIRILSSFKHCTQLVSIVICRCIFSDQSYTDKETVSIENNFRKWLNDNIHLAYEQSFHLECNNHNRTLKL